MSDPQPQSDSERLAHTVRRKVAWRILPLIFILYVVAYLDRANLGFAKRQMMSDLNLSDAVYGLGAGVFFIGYLLLEIPGALLVERWSARKWFTRILVTWGLCSMGMALVRTETQFYVARFLLGLAEAGFFPGVIVYLTHWFPRRDRAKALSGLVFGVPFSLALERTRPDFSCKWIHWVFQAGSGCSWPKEAPAIVLGLFVWFALPDRPKDASWLSKSERESLEELLAAERREVTAGEPMTLGRALQQPTVWLLALGIMAINTGGYALVFWLPTAVQGLLADAGRSTVQQNVLLWTSAIYVCGVAAIYVAGRSSDWTRRTQMALCRRCISRRRWARIECNAGSAMAARFPVAMHRRIRSILLDSPILGAADSDAYRVGCGYRGRGH